VELNANVQQVLMQIIIHVQLEQVEEQVHQDQLQHLPVYAQEILILMEQHVQLVQVEEQAQ
jgi:hypothetical protein